MRCLQTKLTLGVMLILGLTLCTGQTSYAGPFNANNAYIANEFPEPGAETNPFPGPVGGTLQAGYYATPGDPNTFSIAGLSHTDSFAGNPQIEGFFINNNIIVPAVLINTALTPLALNFGGVILGEEMLLHPGNTGGDGFALPASEAVLRYVVPAGGTYTITGAFRDIGGGAVAVDVLRNGVSILSVGAGSDATPFAETLTLNGNDRIDFVVDDANAIGGDSTGLVLNIVPEPSGFVLLSLSSLMVLMFRQKKGDEIMNKLPLHCVGMASLSIVVTLIAQPSFATTITAAGTVVQNSVPGGGVGTRGYVFYSPKIPPQGGGPGPDVASQPSWVTGYTEAAGTARFAAPTGTYSQLLIDGTNYDTGLLYQPFPSIGNIVTINLAASGLPAAGFQLGLLSDNYNYNGVGRPTVSWTVTANGSGSFATQLVNQAPAQFQTNRFYLFDVTNLTPNDTISISGVAGIDGALLGGLTFTPEPSGIALAGISVAVMLSWKRRFRAA